jgi:hypothetical protein
MMLKDIFQHLDMTRHLFSASQQELVGKFVRWQAGHIGHPNVFAEELVSTQ